MTQHDLGHRELLILRTLDCHHRGVPASAAHLTVQEYTSTVIALKLKGLCGAEEQAVETWSMGIVTYVNKVWLTPEGEVVVRGL